MINAEMTFQVLISGILLGALYAAFAIGLSLIWGVLKVINLAHGDMLIFGGYIAYTLFASFNIDPIFSLFLSGLCLFSISVILQKFYLRKIIKGKLAEREIPVLLSTLGISMIFQNIMILTWGNDLRNITTDYWMSSLSIGSFNIPVVRLEVFFLSTIIVFGLYLFLMKTDLGKAIRAVVLDREAAMLMGVKVEKLYLLCFGIGGLISGFSGALLPLVFTIGPTFGPSFLSRSFAVTAVVIARGNIAYAYWAGLALGLSENIVTLFLPLGFREAISGIIIITILMLKPIMGEGQV